MFHLRVWIACVPSHGRRRAASEVGTARIIPGFLAVCLILFGPNLATEAAVQALPGVVIGHNGKDTSGIGTEDVDVDFAYGAVTLGPHQAQYNEIASHRVEYEFTPVAEPAMIADAFITNASGIAWSGLIIRLESADFGGHRAIDVRRATTPGPVVDIGNSVAGLDEIGLDQLGLQHWPPFDPLFSLAGSTLTRSNDQGTGPLDAELTIDFGDPLIDQRTFWLRYNVLPPLGDPAASGFTLTMTPIPVPEPATGMLLGALGIAGLIRRRKPQT